MEPTSRIGTSIRAASTSPMASLMQPRHQSVARKGNAFGADIYKAEQQERKINEVSYEFPKPAATEPSPKTSFVTKVGDLGCGVGYYK